MTMGSRTGMLVAVLACASTACKNPHFCDGNPENNCNLSPDAVEEPGCTASSECAAPTPACDTAAGTCVQCLAPGETAACTGATPVCDADHSCRACEAHAECASQLCLPDGTCGAESDVAYVAKAGTGTACTLAAPCPLLANALLSQLPFVKIDASGTANDTGSTIIDGQTVTIFAEPGASMDRDGDGPLLEVRSAGSNVTIYGLTLTGATGSSGIGVLLTPNAGNPNLTLVGCTVSSNQIGGISVSGGTLSLQDCTVTDNQGMGISIFGGSLTVSRSTIASNDDTGIEITGTTTTFDVTNTFIFHNGDFSLSSYGGVNITLGSAPTSRFEHNTVIDNHVAAGTTRTGGIRCDMTGFTAPNNLIARNDVGGSTTEPTSQTFGNCTYPTSRIQSDVAGLAFESPDQAPRSYRLTAVSSAIDAATTPSTIDIDHEGDARPQGAAHDVGADEYAP